jgi:hypothetical protein
MLGPLHRLFGPAVLAIALAASAPAAFASCAAPTPATACPQCALAVVGVFQSGHDSPSVTVERVIRRRPGLPEAAAHLAVVMPDFVTDSSGVRHYAECAFVPEDGQRMLYLMDPAPGAPGRFRIVWGFTADTSAMAAAPPVADH